MRRYIVFGFGLTLSLAVACSSNSDDYAPPVSEGGSSSKSGAGGRPSTGKSGSGGSDAGSAGEAEDAGSAGLSGSGAGEGGAGGEGGADEGTVIPVPPGSCSEMAAWVNATPVPGISTAANEQLLTITADELDILFARDGVPMLAHRELPSEAFGPAFEQTIAEGYGIEAGAALSADGKTLVLLSTTFQEFAAFSRSSRSSAFELAFDESAFSGINQRALQTMQHYAAPVLAPDGKTFVFSGFTPAPAGGFPPGFEGVSVIYESIWTPNGWAMPESLSQDSFDGTSAARPLPSGLSTDSRTLFYLDEGSGKQMARFRDRRDAPLYTVVDLDQRTHAVPNSNCERLYYSSGGDVLVSDE
ncbi:MAG TPA: hypothetical protein VER12_14815 [Polyangiaceae bacterium]|nr:hypothetical protein [Polyangiaceae bacterium]